MSPAAPAPAADGAKPWRWALAIVSGALFLNNVSLAVTLCLLRLANNSLSVTNNIGVNAALTAAGCCGLALAMPDMKSSLTTIAGGVFIRSLFGVALGSWAGMRLIPLGWLVFGGLSAAVLWWLWLDRPRERGDAARMRMALTVLVSAEALGAAYGYVTHPSQFLVRRVAILVIVIGSLLWLRVRIPGMIGDDHRRV